LIPHKIHQVWVGPDTPPWSMLNTWPEINPDFEYKLWRESDIEALDLTNRALYDALIAEGLYSGAADVVRTEIVFQEGGVYVDADTIAMHPLADAPFMDSGFWIVEEHRDPQPWLVSPAVLGAESRSKPLGAVIESLSTIPVPLPPWSATWVQTGPVRYTHVLRHREDVTYVDPGHFYTRTAHDEPVPTCGIIYGDHRFGEVFARPNVSVVIPFADVGEDRSRIWEWLEPYWMERLHYCEFILQEGPAEGFSKTATLNTGIERASGSVIVAMDADTLMSEFQIEQAIQIARRGSWAMPYDRMLRVREDDTLTVLEQDPWHFDPIGQVKQSRCKEQPKAVKYGAMCQVFPKAAWEDLNGFDERFVGWGQEDEAMKMVLDTLWKPAEIVSGPIFHMWHKRPGENRLNMAGYDRTWPGQESRLPNWPLRVAYKNAEGDAEAMRALLTAR
jgi:hypothetical protein